MLTLFNIIDLPQSSTMAGRFDALFDFLFIFSLFSFLGIVILMVIFVVKYRRTGKDSDKKTPYIIGHGPLEFAVAASLFVVVMIIFVWGWIDYRKIINPPSDALEINVIGQQWLWNIWYLNGRHLTNELVVPKGRNVKLLMSSADVIHSFFIPDFRLKQDVVPGEYTTLWFNATETGDHQVFCAEYCGTAHSQMMATVRVLEPAEYERWQQEWLQAQKAGPKKPLGKVDLAAAGKGVFTSKGCNACHTVTGEKGIGPTLKGIFGSEREFVDGSKTTADENYLRESLMDPQLKVVKGFAPVMPTFRGVLSDEDVNALVQYIKSLK